MTLVSPGVQISIIDQSNYLPAATNSVPYILVATAQNKISGTSTNVAQGTLEANADQVYLITSQRDLATVFGNPFFYKTANGTPINGYELNEYGLLAAYSVLGVTNRCYVQRANIDLAALNATLVRPTGTPNNGTYWFDTAQTVWGINEWNQVTGAFTVETPIVITSTDQLDGGIPAPSLGSIGNYAIVATNTANPTYYKNASNDWVLVGSDDWKASWPTIQGTNSVTGLTAANVLIINGTSVAVPASTNNTLTGLVAAINSAAITGVTAVKDSSNRLVIYGDETATFGGNYGVVVIGAGSTDVLVTALGITEQTYYVPQLQQSPNYTVPRWRTTDDEPAPSGSVWVKTTYPNQGSRIIVKKYDSTIASFLTLITPVYENDQSANAAIDPTGGGQFVPAGALYAQYNVAPETSGSNLNATATLSIFERLTTGATVITGSVLDPAFTNSSTFTISTSTANSTTLTSPVTVTIVGTTTADFVAAVSAAAVPNVSASVAANGAIVFTQSQGGDIVLVDGANTPLADAGITTAVSGVRAGTGDDLILSNWILLSYTASDVAPNQDPTEGTYWYYSAVNQVDIMIQNGGYWKGYQTVGNDVRGYNLTQTDPAGPQISATAPTVQSDATPLVYGDLWIDTSDLEIYPVIKRWQSVDGVNQWVAIDNADQTTENGVLFADARWAPNGTTNPITDAFPTIVSLLSSSYIDLDAPDPAIYAEGTLLFNTRRSGYNVKSFQADYFNGQSFSVNPYDNTQAYIAGEKVLYNGIIYVALSSTTGNLPTDLTYWAELQTNAWVTASGNRADGSPFMGRQAQRSIIVAALKSAIDTQPTLREEQNQFNLIACPQYPELIPNMTALNNERDNTAFIVGDTPLRMGSDATSILNWVTNGNGNGVYANDGLTTADPYAAVFYPSCQTNDTTGSLVVQPPSHMLLRTIVRSDSLSYPWFAPAGTRRGLVDNAAAIGYVNATTGEFVQTATGQGVRDVLYTNKINPITFIPGTGIANYGNKSLAANATALDRINVARLVAYIRYQLGVIAKPFVFEPNDQTTRTQISNAINGLLLGLVTKRGLYDYLVVCDLSNNSPATIDANELYVDIAIEPVKAVEFIYIPVRIMNTGSIANNSAAATAV